MVVRELDTARTGADVQRLAGRAELRSECRSAVKAIAHDAAAHTCGQAGIARALDLSPTAARVFVDPRDDAHPLALGDVVAAAKASEDAAEWADEVLHRCLEIVRGTERVSEASIDRMQRMIARDGGAFADRLDKALADNVVSRDEARELLLIARQARRRWDDVVTKLEGVLEGA